jgi:lysophospholipase L1-like esterase
MTRQDRFVAKAATVASLILAAGGTVSAFGLAYFLYDGWTDRQPRSWAEIVLYYAAPALLAALLFAALWLKPDHRINAAIVCAALTMSVYGAELALRVLDPGLPRSRRPIMSMLYASRDRHALAARLAERFGVEIDARDRLEVITDLRKKGIEAVPSVIPRFQLRYHQPGAAAAPIIALGGISNKLTVLCNESGQHVTYESDEHGFRNPRGLWKSDRVDIVALGDSFTQGYCEPAGKHFMSVVQQRYPGTLNLGMAGEGALLMLATLREYVPPLRPRTVLWVYFEGNDLLDLQDERRSALLMRYLEDGFSQRLVERQAEADQALLDLVKNEEARERARRAALPPRTRPGLVGRVLGLLTLTMLQSRLGLGQAPATGDAEVPAGPAEAELELFRQILSRARASVESWGGTLYFVYLPNWTRYDKRLQDSDDLRAAEGQRDSVLASARELGIPIVDVLPAFEAHGDPMSLFPFRAPGHYTEEGHRLVAEELVKVLATRR